ncbi:MAG: hypothetical protein KA537_00820 [Candidatus Moranbacteria bacterium]|nr:hypothetical protein [Candidatus Moranbacteria bacterium]
MFFDFIIQVFFSGIFFLGVAGVGILLLRSFGYAPSNRFLDIALAYFVSLCLYTAIIVTGLFVFPQKLSALTLLTVAYGLFSFGTLLFLMRKVPFISREFLMQHKTSLTIFSGVFLWVIAMFFLQIYHTSILDEWLHRPVVQEFVSSGVFPLVNPLSPKSDFIHTYHYGTQVIAAALQLIFRLGVSASLDLLKISYFIATFFLCYGMILMWTKKHALSLGGAVLVLFAGSSFFLLDSFTANHLISFKGWGLADGERWPINAPLSYILTGITWVNIPLTIALGVLFERVPIVAFVRRFRWWPMLLVAAVFTGFYLISELFLALFLLVFGMYFVFICYKEAVLFRAMRIVFLWLILLVFGMYFTGGIVGNMFQSGLHRITDGGNFYKPPVSSVTVVNIERSADSFLALRPVSLWGYPSEKRILVVWDRPWYYFRTLFLEAITLVFIAYSGYKRVFIWRDHPILFAFLLFGLIAPFVFSTSFGNLNFSKITTLSFALLHLFIFYLIAKLPINKWITTGLIVLLALGSLPGLLIGSNIQWQWISSKGKSQYCSQNPLCHQEE